MMRIGANCIIIGPASHVGPITKLLEKGDVPSRGFSLNGENHEAVIAECKKEKSLTVIAVLLKDGTDDSAFVGRLRAALPHVAIQAFRESDGSKQSGHKERANLERMGITHFHRGFPLTPAEMLVVLKRGWFPDLALPPEAAPIAVRLRHEDLIERGLRQDIEDARSREDDEAATAPRERLPETKKKANRAERRAAIFTGAPAAKELHGPNVRTHLLSDKEPSPRQKPKRPEAVQTFLKPSADALTPQRRAQLERAIRNAHSVSGRPKAKESQQTVELPLELPQSFKPAVPQSPQQEERWRAILTRVHTAMAAAEYVKLNPAQISPMPDQPREFFDDDHIRELSDSIRTVGQFMPGMVRKVVPKDGLDHYELLDGECRWRAIVLGRVDTYKAMLVHIDDEAAPYVIASIANFHRRGHTHLEKAKAIQRLHEGLGMPLKEIAKMYDIHPIWAGQLYSLRNLLPLIQSMLDPRLKKKKEVLPITAAVEIAKLDPTVQMELLKRYRAREVTLLGLRKAAIEIATRTGTYIRRQADQPSRRLASLLNTANKARLALNDVRSMLGEEGMGETLTASPEAARRVEKMLDEADATVTDCQELLEKHLKR